MIGDLKSWTLVVVATAFEGNDPRPGRNGRADSAQHSVRRVAVDPLVGNRGVIATLPQKRLEFGWPGFLQRQIVAARIAGTQRDYLRLGFRRLWRAPRTAPAQRSRSPVACHSPLDLTSPHPHVNNRFSEHNKELLGIVTQIGYAGCCLPPKGAVQSQPRVTVTLYLTPYQKT